MSTEETVATPERGVEFATRDGKRSSTGAGRSIFARAVAGVDPELSSEIEATRDWRKSYITADRRVTERGVASADDALQIATDGLSALRDELAYVDDGEELSLSGAFRALGTEELHTTTIKGEGDAARELVVPYRGAELKGDALRAQIDDWEARGILEPSATQALTAVIDNPDWLDLSDRTFALLGGSSQMGPLEHLSRWRANLLVVDLPREHLWDTILELSKKGAGRVHIPSDGPATSDDIARKAGVDLLVDAPRVAGWLAEFDGPLTLGNYVYADGARFVRLATAVDALITTVVGGRNDVSIAYLATPTDVFAVPHEVVEGAIANRRSVIRNVLRPITLGKTYINNYSQTFTDDRGRTWGISDSLVPIQGANYALAKALQRWRATVARSEGLLCSANVAPATRTTSVTKNRLLAAAYRGAGAFGVEVFEPETSRAVMAALLVHDLRNPGAAGNPAAELGHPYELFSTAAIHGGIWRLGYEARSVLPLALVLGGFRRG